MKKSICYPEGFLHSLFFLTKKVTKKPRKFESCPPACLRLPAKLSFPPSLMSIHGHIQKLYNEAKPLNFEQMKFLLFEARPKDEMSSKISRFFVYFFINGKSRSLSGCRTKTLDILFSMPCKNMK